MSILKKVVAGFSTFAMAASLLVAPVTAHAAAAGEVYKTSDGTVWFITSDMQRRPFTSAGAFLSYGFLSFSQVKDADASVTALPAGAFIAPADGKIFCATETKGSDVKGECSLITGGQKAAFTSAAVFGGQGFSFSRAIYGDSSFLSKTSNIDNASAGHLAGVLVNNGGTVQMVVSGGLWGIPSIDVFNSWGYSFADVVPANAADKTLAQIGVIPGRVAGQLVPTGTTNPVVTGPVSAALSSDNPGAGTVVTTQAAADLAHFTFSGNGTITAVQLKRIGISADASLQNVYLYDGNTRLTDAASVSSNSVINFSNPSGLFTVNGARTISVRADLNANSGETIGVQLVSATISGGNAVAGPPINGNLMTVASATLAGVSFGGVSPSSSNIDPANDVMVWQSTATVTTRDVNLTRLALREIGSINYSDVNNFRLFVDGTQVAQTQSLDSNGYVTFSLGTPYRMMTGSRVIKVLADVTGGSSRNMFFSLRNKADIGLIDTQYNVGIAESTAVPLGSSSNTLTINGGSVTVSKTTDSPSGNVTLSGSDVPLARYTVTAFGEPVKVDTITVGVINSNGATTIRNGRLMANGSQVGSTANTTVGASGGAGTAYSVNMVITPGSPVTLEFRADIFAASGTAFVATNTLQVRLMTGSSNGIGQVSGTVVNVPGGNTDGNTVTIQSGSIALAKTTNYANQTTVVPQTAYKIADMQLTGNSTEDVNINTISVDFTSVTNATFSATDLTNVYVVYNGVRESSTKSTVAATNNTWSVSHVLAKNTSAQVQIFADIGSSITSGDSIKSTTTVSGVTVSSGSSVNTGAVDGQTIAAGSGSIVSAVDPSSPVAAIQDDSGNKAAAAFKFSATSDNFNITDVVVKFAAAPTAVSTVELRDGATILQTQPAAASVSFSGLSVPVLSNGTKTLTVNLNLATVGVGAGTSGENDGVTLDSFKATSSTGAVTSDTTDRAGSNLYTYKAIPTITNVTPPTGVLTNGGAQVISKFTIDPSGTGIVSWKKIIFSVSKTSAPVITNAHLYDSGTNVEVAGTPTLTTVGSTNLTGTIAFVATNEQELAAGKTYELRVDIASSVAGDSVSTNIASPSSHVAPTDYTTVAGTSASFVWSDESASAHSTSTSDWSNDNLVKNLATTSQTLAR